MNPHDWRRAREVFEAALDVAPSDRNAHLDAACGDDTELRRVVDRLLDDATDDRTTWLDAGASEGMVRRALVARSLEGQHIGDYTIRSALGSGGMATVFEAEQQHPQRSVALKIMRFGLYSEVARRRFDYESEILGRLRHPGIAQVYASGTYRDELTSQELPYFAMELVEGALPLDRYAEQNRTPFDELLTLFIEVCGAVHYGHQRGFIHRDLKPQNILVDVEGRPKVIDFGIARAAGPEREQQTLATLEGEVLGTLSYMSPEQIEGELDNLDLRCDVYALGAVLFQLVSGRVPFEFTGRAITAAMQRIVRETPPLPSSVGGRFAQLPQAADLDCIIMKAIEKDPARRYTSVAELADDLERLRANEPILARPASALYLAKKFVQRHIVAVSAAAAVLVLLLAAIAVTSISLVRAVDAEEKATNSLAQAQLEAETSQSINDFLMDMLSAANPYQDGREVKVIDLLDRASATAGTMHADRPELATALRTTLAATYLRLGQVEQATTHARAALDLSSEALGKSHWQTPYAMQTLAACYLGQDKIEPAAELVTEALEILHKQHGPGHRFTGPSLMTLAMVEFRRNNLDAAAQHYRDARDLFIETAGEGGRSTVSASAGLGEVLRALGHHREAEEMLRFAIEHGEEQLGSDHPTVLVAHNNLGALLLKIGDFDEAAGQFESLLEVEQRVFGPKHHQTLITLNNLASALQKLGRAREAEKYYLDVIARRRDSEHFVHHQTAIAYGNLGVCLESQDRLGDAEASFGDALRLLTECGIPASHWLGAAFRKGLAVVRTKQGRFAEAEEMLKDSLATFEQQTSTHQMRIQRTLEAMLALYEAWDKPDQARQTRERLAKN